MKEGEMMPNILHRVGIKATPQKVFKALSTTDGLSHWWIVGTKGNPKEGGIIDFEFAKMRVVESIPNKRVKWKCVEGHEEWVGTDLIKSYF